MIRILPSGVHIAARRRRRRRHLQRAKVWAGMDVKGLGFHGQKRAGVRRREFQELAPKGQEALTGTTHETLRRVYDEVSFDEMPEAVRRLGRPAA
ncbi:MAG TPA: hypothetical protein VHG93_29200 [Longimicrobium sp.]|nr:hypothetical protein [Longimicrobium sp.]